MSSINLITDIPAILALECMCNWLSLKDVCRLESAFSVMEERQLLLQLFRKPAFLMKARITLNDWNTLKWLRLRGIRVPNVELNFFSTSPYGPRLSNYLNVFGMHMRYVHFFKIPTSLLHQLANMVAKHCRHLVSITFDTCIWKDSGWVSSMANIESVLLHNPYVEVLRFDRVVHLSNVPLQTIAKHCKQLKELHINTVDGTVNSTQKATFLSMLASCSEMKLLRLSSNLLISLNANAIVVECPGLQVFPL